MKTAFLETEEGDRRYFEEALGEYELAFPQSASDVAGDTEILSIFIGTRISDDFLARYSNLRMICTRSTTCDHIDLESCARRGVVVCDVPSYGDHIVAEHTFALLLALTRRLREAMKLNGRQFSYEALRGTELHGKTFGIFGAGRIGRKTAPIAEALGMKVIANDVVRHPDAEALGIQYVAFKELLCRSDVISLHASLNNDTFHIFDREAFAQCRPGTLLINTARGQLIDTAALVEALECGIMGGAGLDVLGEESALRREPAKLITDQIMHHLHDESPRQADVRSKQIGKLILIGRLLARTNVVFTPHTAFNCVESIGRINEITVRNIRRFVEGGPVNSVYPENSTRILALRPSDEFCLAARRPAAQPL